VRRAALLAVATLTAAVAAAGQPTLEVQLVPERFGVEDVARLVIRIEGGEPEGGPPRPSTLENLEIVGGPSVSHEFSVVNGRVSSAVTYTWLVRAREVGPAAVGPVEVTVDGTRLASSSIVTQVAEGSVAPPRRVPRWRDPLEELFGVGRPRRPVRVALRYVLGRRRAVVGQVVPVAVVLDTTAGVEGFEWVRPCSFPGWWSQEVPRPERIEGTSVTVHGVRYRRYPVARYVLVPLSAGKLELPPCTARIGLASGGIFAPGQVVERSTSRRIVEVAAPPEPPEGFHGAVGDLRYSARIEPRRVGWGDSAMLVVRLEGRGNLPLAEAPLPWPAPEGCEIYPPEESSKVTVTPAGPRGTRVWRSAVVPRRPGRIVLPAVPVAVLDPESGRYRTARLGPLALEVAPPPATPTPPPTPAPAPAEAAGAAPAPRPGAAPGAAGGGVPPWAVVAAAAAGALAGALLVALLFRRRRPALPPRLPGRSPAERARELQQALEGWWAALPERRRAHLAAEVEAVRRELEAVRFAPGRADHTETVAALERRVARLLGST